MDQWNPKQYEKFKEQRAKPFWDLANLVQVKKDLTVLDLGCGTGELTSQLHQKLNAKETLGIDSSKNMLEIAKAFQNSSLKFEQHDIGTFQPSKKFELIFSNAALQWLEGHEELFKKIFSWVSDQGQIAVQMPANFDHPSHAVAADVASRYFPDKFKSHKKRLGILGIDSYAEMLFKNGFVDQQCMIKVYAHPMKSGLEVVEWTKGTLLTSYQKQLTEQEFTKFLEIYTTELLKIIGEGPYFYGFKRMLLWGTKES